MTDSTNDTFCYLDTTFNRWRLDSFGGWAFKSLSSSTNVIEDFVTWRDSIIMDTNRLNKNLISCWYSFSITYYSLDWKWLVPYQWKNIHNEHQSQHRQYFQTVYVSKWHSWQFTNTQLRLEEVYHTSLLMIMLLRGGQVQIQFKDVWRSSKQKLKYKQFNSNKIWKTSMWSKVVALTNYD